MKVSFRVYCHPYAKRNQEYYACHIFGSLKEMYEYNNSTGYFGKDYLGLCRAYTKYKANKKGKRMGKKTKEIGAVSLFVNKCGAGVVSHEFAHAATYWFNSKHDPSKFGSNHHYDEKFAHCLSGMVNQFYNKWYKLEDNGTIKKIRKATK